MNQGTAKLIRKTLGVTRFQLTENPQMKAIYRAVKEEYTSLSAPQKAIACANMRAQLETKYAT